MNNQNNNAAAKLLELLNGDYKEIIMPELLGEIEMQVDDVCGDCDHQGPDDDCETCGGEIKFKRTVIITSDTLEAILEKSVKALLDEANKAKEASDNAKSEIMNDLYESSIRIENVFHMPLISACDSMPNGFWEVFEDNNDEVIAVLGLSNNVSTGDYLLKSKNNLLDFLHDHKKHGVLIQFSTPICDRFQFNEQGEFLSCSCSWSAYMSHFSYGNTLDEAISNAIVMREQDFERCIEEAKRKETESTEQ